MRISQSQHRTHMRMSAPSGVAGCAGGSRASEAAVALLCSSDDRLSGCEDARMDWLGVMALGVGGALVGVSSKLCNDNQD